MIYFKVKLRNYTSARPFCTHAAQLTRLLTMPMTLEQLVKLYILQKNAHLYKNPKEQQLFELECITLMSGIDFEKSDMMAPALFENQPNIPFVFVKPKNATIETPSPLIIHTHGGPNVYMSKDSFHAEIAYFISHGYTVACPNYRGSTNYPEQGDDPEGWKEWEALSEGKHHIYGPEDVYAVTKFVCAMPFIDKDKIYLRGGSFGSFINAHLLAEVKQGTYENIFKGAHLSGGLKYPVPSTMPEDVPLLITHSVHDHIAPYADARIFMEKMLQKQLSYEAEEIILDNLQTFISLSGDHHLINPQLKVDHNGSDDYLELVTYLQHTTSFINTLRQGKKYQPIDSYDQFKSVMSDKDKDEDPAQEVLQRVYAYQLTRQLAQKELEEESADSSPRTSDMQSVKNTPYYGPTCALLKLQLGTQFTGNIRTDLLTYFKDHFAPIDWTEGRNKLTDAGSRILGNAEFVEQMVQVIENEERFLQQNSNHVAIYHTAEPNSLQLYTFINLWQAILKNQPIRTLPVIKELRLYDFMKNTFDEINVFLLKMRLRRQPNDIFNNTPGFPERAIACNPSLISNAHSTASCSFWWYFHAKENDRAPIADVVADMLKVLGIYSKERMERYLHLFKREKERLGNAPQALLQQIFVPYNIAKESAYMCQIWGEEFKHNSMQLDSPCVMKELTAAPELFEEVLRTNKNAFTNFGDCEGFGDTVNGFKYANTLQLRYLPRNDKDIATYSYFRSPKAHQNLVHALGKLIREDYADYLAYGNSLPTFILKDAKTAKQTLISQSRLGMFQPKERFNLHAFEIQQQELYKGLVQNPSKELYGSIIAIPQCHKVKLQERLREINGSESKHPVFLFSLCSYLKGYTYYDLLKEAAEAAFLHDKISPDYKKYAQENYHFIMEMIELFSIPSSIKEVKISGEKYSQFYRLMQENIRNHQYNDEKHQFIQPASAQYYDRYLFTIELTSAVTCVLKHARLAKELGYGHNIDSALENQIYGV